MADQLGQKDRDMAALESRLAAAGQLLSHANEKIAKLELEASESAKGHNELRRETEEEAKKLEEEARKKDAVVVGLQQELCGLQTSTEELADSLRRQVFALGCSGSLLRQQLQALKNSEAQAKRKRSLSWRRQRRCWKKVARSCDKQKGRQRMLGTS